MCVCGRGGLSVCHAEGNGKSIGGCPDLLYVTHNYETNVYFLEVSFLDCHTNLLLQAKYLSQDYFSLIS